MHLNRWWTDERFEGTTSWVDESGFIISHLRLGQRSILERTNKQVIEVDDSVCPHTPTQYQYRHHNNTYLNLTVAMINNVIIS